VTAFDVAPRRMRWPRSQRFVLTESGVVAEAAYRSTIVASRAQAGRESFDDARREWATRFALQVDDGLCLCELHAGSKTASEIVEALDTCGQSRTDTIAALERLWTAGLVAGA